MHSRTTNLLSHHCYLLLIVALVLSIRVSFADESHDWKSDWELTENFSLTIDSEGYDFPTAIAFVPNPGTDPKAPLYFVTEIRGKVKVVTNDRTVYTFAEGFFKLKPKEELPAISGESGLAGICLDPVHGYVFVTFAYHDKNKILRNNIIKFQTKPVTFSLKPNAQVSFADIFSSEISAYSHQIGPCQVYDNSLFVSVGNAFMDSESQNVDSLLGKVIRMRLDGKPVGSNPFYVDDDINKARNYVWAYGFRNPFGLKIVDGRLFVADNGANVDRFLEVQKGVNYLWDGNDWSIGTNADAILAPGVGVAQLDFCPDDLDIFPEEYRRKFYLVLSGELGILGPDPNGGKSIAVLDFGFEENKMLMRPYPFIKYRGSLNQILVGLAIGPDGLYFVPILPDESGRSAVYKVRYDKDSDYPFLISHEENVIMLMQSHGCFSCHLVDGLGEGTNGPSLDRKTLAERIRQRLDSPEYAQFVKSVDSMNSEPFKSHKSERHEILELKGMGKIKTWVKYHLLEPKFDNPASQMPNLNLTPDEADIITDFLLIGEISVWADGFKKGSWRLVKRFLPEPKYRHFFYSFMFGVFIMFLFAVGYSYYWRRRQSG